MPSRASGIRRKLRAREQLEQDGAEGEHVPRLVGVPVLHHLRRQVRLDVLRGLRIVEQPEQLVGDAEPRHDAFAVVGDHCEARVEQAVRQWSSTDVDDHSGGQADGQLFHDEQRVVDRDREALFVDLLEERGERLAGRVVVCHRRHTVLLEEGHPRCRVRGLHEVDDLASLGKGVEDIGRGYSWAVEDP